MSTYFSKLSTVHSLFQIMAHKNVTADWLSHVCTFWTVLCPTRWLSVSREAALFQYIHQVTIAWLQVKCSSQQKQTKTPKATTTKSVIPPIGVCSDLISLSLWRRPFWQFHISEWDEIFDWSIFFFTHSESVLHNALLFYIFRLLDLIACAAGPPRDNKLFWLGSPRRQ